MLNKIWNSTVIKSSKNSFLSVLSTGLNVPSSKGKQLIIMHIESDSGFLPDGLLIFKSNKNDDYHKDINADCFENIFKNLKIIELFVMENALDHSRKKEKYLNVS